MNDLIQINCDHENPTVSGRELHAKLEVNTDYPHWFARMCDYGFREGKDFAVLVGQKCPTNNPKNPWTTITDHALSIPMAKELCMLQRSDKGREFRLYFISIEEAWNTPDKIMERAWQIIHQRALEAERRVFALTEEKETLEIALNTSLQFYTVAKYNKTFKKGWNCDECKAIGKRLTAYCRARAVEVRACETNDERFGTVNSYPITAWEAFLEEVV